MVRTVFSDTKKLRKRNVLFPEQSFFSLLKIRISRTFLPNHSTGTTFIRILSGTVGSQAEGSSFVLLTFIPFRSKM